MKHVHFDGYKIVIDLSVILQPRASDPRLISSATLTPVSDAFLVALRRLTSSYLKSEVLERVEIDLRSMV